MILYFSGSCGSLKGWGLVSEPEDVLGRRACVMLSYYLVSKRQQEQHKRMERLTRARNRRKGKR